MSYQPTWIGGRETTAGDRSCADRYAVIASIVDAYRRRLTVWDLGANRGYFGIRLAESYGCVSVMADARPLLPSVCSENGLSTTIAMTHHFSAQDLRELAASEHADVVLALNVLHHFDDWQDALVSVCELGEDVLIETPGRGDVRSANYEVSQALLDAIEGFSPERVATFPSHVTPGVRRPLYRIRQRKDRLTAGYAYGGRVRARGPHPPREHVIASTVTEKTVTMAGASRPWLPGMNLWNWLQFGGSYPSRADVRAAVIEAAEHLESPHGDLRPWNVILQGLRVSLIDAGHRASCDDAVGLSDTLAWIDHPERAYVH